MIGWLLALINPWRCEGSGNTRQQQCLSHEGSENKAKAVSYLREVVLHRALVHHGEKSVKDSGRSMKGRKKAVKSQGKALSYLVHHGEDNAVQLGAEFIVRRLVREPARRQCVDRQALLVLLHCVEWPVVLAVQSAHRRVCGHAEKTRNLL